MAIKGGDLIHVANQILIDRAQTAGPGTVNINSDKIYELGNYKSIGTIFDTPDLTFTVESFDVSTEFESVLLNQQYSTTDSTTGVETVTMADGTMLDPAKSLPIDVASAFKPGVRDPSAYNVVGSVSIPYLTLESLSYRFGISDNAQQTAGLRGDSLFYSPTTSYIEYFTGTGAAGQQIALTNPAIVYQGDTVNGDRYALSVTVVETGKRLTFGAEYTEAPTGTGQGRAVTLTLANAVPNTQHVRVSYASTQAASYPQVSHAPVTAIRPAAIRGRNIEVFMGGVAVTNRWTSVQSVNVDWRVTLDKDEELGNSQAVSQDFDVPEVSGSIEVKPRDYADLYNKICVTAGVTPGQVVGAVTTVVLPLRIVLHSPDIPAPGSPAPVLKTLVIPKARFTLPGYSGRAGTGQKMTVTFDFSSEDGALLVFKGAAPAVIPAY